MTSEGLLRPGTELKELQFDNFLDWFVKVTDVSIHWKYEPSYIISQASYLFGALCTLIHAFYRGGRFLHLWLAIFIHAFVVESICYIAPDVDNFWHSQTPIIFLGRRFPLHIMLLYQCFYYNASMAVAKARLSRVAEACAVGLASVLIDVCYDIVSVRYVHWYWHDTDPNIYDRHYWVPWNSYYFHATFSAGLVFWFHFLKDKLCQSEGQWIYSKKCFKEFVTTILASLLGAPTGILLFLPIYHPLHDNFKIHSEVTFFMLLTVFLVIIWSADRKQKIDEFAKTVKHRVHWTTVLLFFYLLVHFAVWLMILFFFNPEDEISTGIKERIGPCDQYSPVRTAFGQILQKRKYLCVTDYDEKYFDFKCLKGQKPPANGSLWYTACGSAFTQNERIEYIAIISTLTFLGVAVFYNLHFKSFGDEVFIWKSRTIQEKNVTQKKKNK